MLDHVSIQVTDLAASRAFYEQLLAPLGVSVTMDFGGVFVRDLDGHNIEAVCHQLES